MKPRLQSAPWTDEDKAAIAFRLQGSRGRQEYSFYDKHLWCLESDRRDADVMLEAQRANSTIVLMPQPEPHRYGEAIDVRGQLRL